MIKEPSEKIKIKLFPSEMLRKEVGAFQARKAMTFSMTLFCRYPQPLSLAHLATPFFVRLLYPTSSHKTLLQHMLIPFTRM